MDHLASPSRIVVLLPHVSKESFKLVEKCSMPLTGSSRPHDSRPWRVCKRDDLY
jgi:acyl CoA:acetate/3-ketoacid CoA transferase beta subunit